MVSNTCPSRRALLYAGAATLGSLPLRALANPAVAPISSPVKEQSVLLRNVHTGEQLHIEFDADVNVSRKVLRKFCRFMRDHYSGEKTQMDPKLIEHLFHLQRELCVAHGSFEIVSAYRSPKTNSMLRRRGRRVATNSMHMEGRAIDMRLDGVQLSNLRNAALDLKAGGVGFYRNSDFLHFDTGRVRHW